MIRRIAHLLLFIVGSYTLTLCLFTLPFIQREWVGAETLTPGLTSLVDSSSSIIYELLSLSSTQNQKDMAWPVSPPMTHICEPR